MTDTDGEMLADLAGYVDLRSDAHLLGPEDVYYALQMIAVWPWRVQDTFPDERPTWASVDMANMARRVLDWPLIAQDLGLLPL